MLHRDPSPPPAQAKGYDKAVGSHPSSGVASQDGFCLNSPHCCLLVTLPSFITFFADDMLYQWEVSDVLQMQRVLRMIGFILDFLEHHGLQANLDKTVVLAKFVGYQHTKAWSKNTERHPDRGLCGLFCCL